MIGTRCLLISMYVGTTVFDLITALCAFVFQKHWKTSGKNVPTYAKGTL